MALVLTPNTSAICAAVRGPRFSESSSRAAYRNGCEMTRSICRVRTSNTSGRSSYRGAGCGPAGLPGFALRQGFSVFPPVIVRRLRHLRAALVRTAHCSSHAHRPVSLVPPTISGRIPVFLRYINIYISLIAGSRDACFAGTRHCARVASRCATPHRVTL